MQTNWGWLIKKLIVKEEQTRTYIKDGPKVVKGNYEMIDNYDIKNCNFGDKQHGPHIL